MKWKYCNYCPLDGTCENQDREHECEMPVKKLLEENQQLKELLKECQYMILAYSVNHDTFTKEKVLDTVKQIDNAIGEKK